MGSVRQQIFISLACAVFASQSYGFNLDALKGAVEQLQKSLPNQQNSSNPSSTDNAGRFNGDAPKTVNSIESSRRQDGSVDWGFHSTCFSEDGPLGLTTDYWDNQFKSPANESLVTEWFSVNPVIAGKQIKEQLAVIRPEIGTSLGQFLADGGVFSGEVRGLGMEFVLDPSVSNLSRIIQEGVVEKKGFGKPVFKLRESQLLLAVVAIQLEPLLLKDKSVIDRLLSESRKDAQPNSKQKYIGRSPAALALSARVALWRNKDIIKFDSFITQSTQIELPGGRKCSICWDTINWATDGGVPDWNLRERYLNGREWERQQQLTKQPFNPPNWDESILRLDNAVAELNTLSRKSLAFSKSGTRAETKGNEAERISTEGQGAMGTVPDKRFDSVVTAIQVGAPEKFDQETKAALQKVMVKRLKINNDIQELNRLAIDAALSGDYSLVDISKKSTPLHTLTKLNCLNSFAENRARFASGTVLPDLNDVSEEESELR